MTDTFGEELRRRRERARLTVAELARRIHYSKGHLSNIENGRKHANVDFAERCDAELGADGQLIELWRAQPQTVQVGPSVKPAQLPAGISYFVGRSVAMAKLDSVLTGSRSMTSVPIIAIDGVPGVGKTALAIRWAHDRANHFPDGALFADLRGYGPDGPASPPEDVLGEFLRALGAPGSTIPEGATARAGLFRSLLDGRRVLVVLDNAATSDQVRPLLPGSIGCLVVVTSRNRLSGLTVRNGAMRLTLQPLRPDEGVSLLRNIIGTDRIDAEPDAAGLLATRCANLPLALRIAAERAALRPNSTLAELADDLADERDRLNVLAVDDDESSALRTVFSWSYRTLPANSARMFRYISLHPGRDITSPAAAALVGVAVSDAARTLDQLASSHLLDEHIPNRYRLPALLHTYSAERFAAEEQPSTRSNAVTQVLTWYLHTAANAARAIGPHQRHLALPQCAGTPEPLLFPDHHKALTWCDAELDNLVAGMYATAVDQLEKFAWQLPLILGTYFDLCKAWQPWIATHHLGLSAARRQGNRLAEAQLLTNLATAYLDLGRIDEAHDLLDESLAIQREIGDQHGEALTLIHLGRSLAAQATFDKALARYLTALQVLPKVGDDHGEATALVGVAEVYCAAGQHQLAREPVEAALTIFRRLHDRRGEGAALDSLALTYHGMGYADAALAEFDQALETRRDACDHHGRAVTLHRRGQVLHELGLSNEACSAWRNALVIFDKLGDPFASDVRARLRRGVGSKQVDDEAC